MEHGKFSRKVLLQVSLSIFMYSKDIFNNGNAT